MRRVGVDAVFFLRLVVLRNRYDTVVGLHIAQLIRRDAESLDEEQRPVLSEGPAVVCVAHLRVLLSVCVEHLRRVEQSRHSLPHIVYLLVDRQCEPVFSVL